MERGKENFVFHQKLMETFLYFVKNLITNSFVLKIIKKTLSLETKKGYSKSHPRYLRKKYFF